ncbi:uroporphyrinogen decarboxylase family protein [Desulfobacula sp.]|uniref:uroporphyrinogen decarboxylase family protein n=1 Tax=Desulfobacula sp. TaxID=2593537 RepID=UPI002610DD5E|nr:uroporphyrinogen decarboxylase family protein [Desulfobacula sp.]
MNRINISMSNRPVHSIPRGELWLGTDLLKRAGYTDTLENHFRLVDQLGQDMICLPIADDTSHRPVLGYRYFDCRDLNQATRNRDRFVAAVVDGPFQELTNRMGLMAVLTGWVQKRPEMARAYAVEQTKVLELISGCLDQGVHAVVIAEDLAADQGLLMSPTDIGTLCSSFYTRAVPIIHEANARAFLHSCGNITQLITLIKTWQVDGLASVQHRANDLPGLRNALGSSLVIMAGIDAELLASDDPRPDVLKDFENLITSLAPGGGLILSSSCGLYSGDFFERIQRIYAMADRLVED